MRNCCLQFIGWCFVMLFLAERAQAQCTFDVGAEIEDLETITLQFSIENLLNADLSAGQGICAVELHFRHSYVGDLTIDLVSPSGQVVQLVGEVTDQISPTNLTTWDIQFLRCGFPASPDAGFSAQWNNDQPWQVFTTYTGSYYPANGCLEDFNTGSANGIWQLIVTDHDAPQTGELLGVTLIFCDNTGLICNLCGVDAGTFAQSTVTICEGSEVSIAPLFSDTMPDPQFYGYTFLVSPDQVNHAYTEQVNATVFAPGTYTICGVSYSIVDSAALFAQLDTMTLAEIQTAFNSPGFEHCADLTEQCITLEIDQAVDTAFLDQQICAGATVTVGGQTFSTSGIHVVHVDRNGACDSIVVLDLDVVIVEARIQQQDTISCTNGVTTLDGSISIAGPGAMYLWTTQNGNIISPADQDMIEIDGPGSYTLQIFYQGCTDILVYDVIGDNSIPFLFVEGGVLDCNNQTFRFRPVAYPTNVEYSWTGPNGFNSQEQQPEVSIPGFYMLLITDPLGCSAAASVEVEIDTGLIAVVQHVFTECIYQRGTLRAQYGIQGYTFLWTLPGGMTSTNQEIYATMSGQYCVEVTGANGCSDVACIDYVADYTFPDVTLMISDDSVHCNTDVILTAMSSFPGVNFQWYGPGGLLPSGPIQSINSPGQYIVTVAAPNACVSRDTVIIFPGDDLLEFGTFADTLSCRVDTALIGVAIFDPVSSYIWSGPGLVDTFLPFVEVTLPGNYEVEIVGQSGCTQHASIEVIGDYATVYFTVQSDTITCIDPIAELTFIAYNPIDVIDWLLPDGSHSDGDTLTTMEPGKYDLTIVGVNGCPRTLVLNVAVDTTGPRLFLEADPLGCNDSVQVLTVKVDSIENYQWTGPGGYTSTQSNPFVELAGNYTLQVAGINGCITELMLSIESNMDLPSFTLEGEELNCLDSLALLTLMSTDSGVVYAWFMDGIQITSTADVFVSSPGEYIGVIRGMNGCVAMDTIVVLPPSVPQVFTQTDTVTCITEAMLTVTSDVPDVDFFWQDAVGLTGTGSQFSTPNPGLVTIIGTATNGCTSDTTFIIAADTISPLAVANSNGLILCELQSITLDGSASLGQVLSYQWNTPNGIINTGADSSSPQITGEGVYILAVTDVSNGCTDTDTLLVEEQQSTLDVIFLTAISECEGNGNASISIDSVSGATTDLIYMLDGETGGPSFDFLTSGQYHIEVIDSFGCSLDSVVIISNTSSMSTLSLGEDKSIIVGDSVLLEAIVELDSSQIQSVSWGQPVDCDSCLSNFVAPLHTAIYEVFVTDIFGCLASDMITVFVEERPKFYVPNVFSPNGDNINDELTVWTHPGIERVMRFIIFDRWGNVVFHATDFVGDGSVRWDGSFGGRKLDPAAFVYVLEVKLLTGRVLTNHGTITLVK